MNFDSRVNFKNMQFSSPGGLFQFLNGRSTLTATPTSYPPGTQENSDGPYVMAPPPMGYPTKDGDNRGNAPVETTNRGDGCLKGW